MARYLIRTVRQVATSIQQRNPHPITTDTTRQYLVAYDIHDDARRTHIAHTLESYGDRIQYSVFLIRIRPSRIVHLQDTLETMLAKESDAILVCDLGTADNCHLTYLGHHRPVTNPGTTIL